MPSSFPQHRVVLTGSSGCLGRNFLDLVANDPAFEVLCLLRPSSRAYQGSSRIRFSRVDFTARDETAEILRDFKPTCFVHAAAATGMHFPKTEWFDLIRSNIGICLNFCETVSHHPHCRFIYISTGLAYRDQGRALHEGDPIDTLHPYGASKAAADILMRSASVEFGVPITVLRPFAFTGLWDDQTRLFPSLLRAAAEHKPAHLSPCDQLRDFCSARDIAAGIHAAITIGESKKGDSPRIYNLGSGLMIPLHQVIDSVVETIGIDVDLHYGERSYAPQEPKCLVADIQAAKRDLGWQPRHNLAHAVWQLAKESFPKLSVEEPAEILQPPLAWDQSLSKLITH